MLFQDIDYSTNFSKFNVLFNEFSKLKKIIFIVNCFEIDLNDMFEFFDISKTDNDLVILSELLVLIDVFENKLYRFEIESFFVNENDKCNAFLDVQSGSGGIDAQDWASMLLNMYSCWANRNEFKFDLLNVSYGEVAGIKNASIKISGDYSYGWLKLESGIHRLVRKSPFSSNGKRHTSFASVFVYPDNYKDLKIDISDSDLKIDTYKSGGAGGQHVNKTDSAVRITHIPTGIIVQCQSNRSQHKNKSQAIDQLKSKLHNLELLDRKSYKESFEKSKLDIAWGNQIRSYILDQSLVKDLRTNFEMSDVKLVLDGNIEPFMLSILNKNISVK